MPQFREVNQSRRQPIRCQAESHHVDWRPQQRIVLHQSYQHLDRFQILSHHANTASACDAAISDEGDTNLSATRTNARL